MRFAPAGGKAKEEKPLMNGTAGQKQKKYIPTTDKIRTSTKESIEDKTKGVIRRQEDSSTTTNNALLSVDNKSDAVRRTHSWGKSDEERPELHKRVSSSLDDLTKGVGDEEKAENMKVRGMLEGLKSKRPVSLNLEKLESPKEEGNKLADILDSIKKASDKTKSTSLNDVDASLNGQDSGLLSANKSNLHTKSYSYSCLADLKLGDDGNPVDEQKSG